MQDGNLSFKKPELIHISKTNLPVKGANRYRLAPFFILKK